MESSAFLEDQLLRDIVRVLHSMPVSSISTDSIQFFDEAIVRFAYLSGPHQQAVVDVFSAANYVEVNDNGCSIHFNNNVFYALDKYLEFFLTITVPYISEVIIRRERDIPRCLKWMEKNQELESFTCTYADQKLSEDDVDFLRDYLLSVSSSLVKLNLPTNLYIRLFPDGAKLKQLTLRGLEDLQMMIIDCEELILKGIVWETPLLEFLSTVWPENDVKILRFCWCSKVRSKFLEDIASVICFVASQFPRLEKLQFKLQMDNDRREEAQKTFKTIVDLLGRVPLFSLSIRFMCYGELVADFDF